jgi:hypothetical protein
MADLSLQQATTIVEAALRKARETGCAPRCPWPGRSSSRPGDRRPAGLN